MELCLFITNEGKRMMPELIAMNKLAIVLALDSAITVAFIARK